MKFAIVRCVGLLSLLCVVGSAHVASAVTITFEDPPYVAGGTVVGQDGWIANSYIGAGNGTADVSTNAPLAGLQSLLYTQTNANSFADVSRNALPNVVSDGTQALDFFSTFLLQSDVGDPNLANGQLGLFLGPDGFNGASRAGILLNNVNSTGGTGQIEVLSTAGFPNLGAYNGGDVLEFRLGVNLDSAGGEQNFEAAVRNVTLGEIGFTQLVGPLAGGRFGFFPANGWPDNGTANNYTVDVGLFLRGGIGRVDNITVQIPEPAALALAMLGLSAVVFVRRARS